MPYLLSIDLAGNNLQTVDFSSNLVLESVNLDRNQIQSLYADQFAHTIRALRALDNPLDVTQTRQELASLNELYLEYWDLCDFFAQQVLQYGDITQDEYEAYKAIEFAPIISRFSSNGQPIVTGWTACEDVVYSYDLGF